MSPLDHDNVLAAAEAAIRDAQNIREFHRKRTKVGSGQRNTDIRHAERRIRTAMRPIRSALGRFPYLESTEESIQRYNELLAMSARIQAERRKLWKLRTGGKKGRK